MIDFPEPQQPQPAWTVTSQEPTTQFVPGKGAVRAIRVNFKLWNGTNDYVEIPLTEFNPKHVAEVIDAHAQNLHEVSQLQGPMITPGT